MLTIKALLNGVLKNFSEFMKNFLIGAGCAGIFFGIVVGVVYLIYLLFNYIALATIAIILLCAFGYMVYGLAQLGKDTRELIDFQGWRKKRKEDKYED